MTSQMLLILGAGEFAEDVADMANECGYEVKAFVGSKNRENCRTTILNKPVYWVDEIAEFADHCEVICALGTTFRGEFIDQVQQMGFRFTTLIHPFSFVSKLSTVKTGSVICAGVVISAGCVIGRHVLINRGSLIGHHVQINDYTTVSPGANIGGACKIAQKVYLGMGSIIRNGCSVGKSSIVGAGAVVVKDVPQNVQVMGVPAKIVKNDVGGL
jgi:acetyltransferase EpsM